MSMCALFRCLLRLVSLKKDPGWLLPHYRDGYAIEKQNHGAALGAHQIPYLPYLPLLVELAATQRGGASPAIQVLWLCE